MAGDEVPDWLAGIRDQVGGQALTGDQHAVLREALAPVLADMMATRAVIPVVGAFQWDAEPGTITAFIGVAHHGQGIRIRTELPAGELLADLADQVQEWEIEELWLERGQATWPECPDHPRSHPLAPGLDEHGAAVWLCPRSGQTKSVIGALTR